MAQPTDRELEAIELELRTHEVQCDERWRTTFKRLEDIEGTLLRIETRTMTLGGTVILFLATLVITVVTGGAP